MLAIAPLMLTACGEDEGSAPDAAVVDAAGAAYDPALEGLWVIACSGDSAREMTIRGNGVLHRAAFYADADTECVQPLRLLTGYETYRMRGESPTAAGATQLDLELERITLTAADAQLADHWNQIGYCGHTDWELGAEVEVAGLTCEDGDQRVTFAEVGTVLHSIYAIERQAPGGEPAQLYLGDPSTGDGATEATRPTQLLTTPWLQQEQ